MPNTSTLEIKPAFREAFCSEIERSVIGTTAKEGTPAEIGQMGEGVNFKAKSGCVNDTRAPLRELDRRQQRKRKLFVSPHRPASTHHRAPSLLNVMVPCSSVRYAITRASPSILSTFGAGPL